MNTRFDRRSFVGGALASTLCWSIGLLCVSIARYRVNDSIEEEERHGEGEAISSSEDVRSDTRIRWPWDTIRKRVINASSSFLSLSSPSDDNRGTVPAHDKALCIGEIFGIDVGGTLTKLVYFEQEILNYKRAHGHEGLHRKEHYTVAACASEVLQARHSRRVSWSPSMLFRGKGPEEEVQASLLRVRQESVPDNLDAYGNSNNLNGQSEEVSPVVAGMKRSSSLKNFAQAQSSDHAEVLGNFYSFASKLDTYETAVKDKYLSYYSRYLNGTFHFIRFETRRMSNAMALIRYNNIHLNIKEIGATGGGAHKYAPEWVAELGINMAKQDEMDSLVAGMQFMLTDKSGECYTFKPNDWSPRPILRGSENKKSASSTSDQWWTSKKVQRDMTLSYPYLLVSIGTGVSIIR